MKKKLLMTVGAMTLTGMFAFGEANALSVQVTKGDTLYSIAKKNDVSLDALKKENKLTSNTIFVGQRLTIPGKGNANTPVTPVENTTKKVVNVSANDVLNVRSGPSVSNGIIGKLSNKTVIEVYSVSGDWAKIKHGNGTGYVHKDYLKDVVNSTPVTPKPTPSTPPVSETPVAGKTYTVEKGDNLYRIGIKFGVSYQDIKKWNNLTSEDLYVGQVLTVSTESETPSTPTNPPAPNILKPSTYVIKSGDTLFKIASETGVSVATLKSINNLSSDTIHAGQVLKLSKGLFMNPSEGILTSTYGQRWGKMHWGIDIAKAGIVPIVAAYDGNVTHAKWNDGWGNYVVIEHVIDGQKYFTLYGHMRDNSLAVKAGDTVKAEEQIGLMGNTGNSTGQHLHLELYLGSYSYGKTNVDPLDYFTY